MERTGERYTTARAHLLAKLAGSKETALVTTDSGYAFAPGICRDTGAARNMLSSLGVRTPGSDEPLSEAMITGIAGGIGFLYIVFEYKGFPPLLSTLMRYDTSADQFVMNGIDRMGIGAITHETTSAAKAEKTLLAALDDNRPVLCVVDAMSLNQIVGPAMLKGNAPKVVCATGYDGDQIVLDTGGSTPLTISRKDFAQARAAFKKGKNKLLEVPRDARPENIVSVIHDAIAKTADRYENAPYKGYASNFGFAGMRRWAKMLTDDRDLKGWATLFPEGRLACLGLRRVYEGLTCEMTPPAGGRAMYAEFLREAATLAKHSAYTNAAYAYDTAATHWSSIATFIADCDIREVRSGCDMIDSYSEMLDANAIKNGEAEWIKLRDSTASCDITHEQAMSIYADLARLVENAIEAETHAASLLCDAVASVA